jgi:myo-inositol-1(or 4)-monophosphatase
VTTAASTAPDPRTKEGLQAILTIVQASAREAATLVLGGFRRRPEIEHKGAVDLVTHFDRDSEALLRRRLGDALPSFAIVGEEGGGVSADGSRGHEGTFYVDPVDGTTNFVHGHPFWCVSIGLVVDDAPVLGVVTAPVLGLEWFGWVARSGDRLAVRRDERAGRDEPCLPSANATLDDALLATGFPYDRRTSLDNNFDAFVSIKKKCQAIRRCGSAAMDLCLVADGTYDGYWERKLRPWDIAAGIAIVRAAGGRVTNLRPPTPNGDDREFRLLAADASRFAVIATNGVLHPILTAALASVETPSST